MDRTPLLWAGLLAVLLTVPVPGSENSRPRMIEVFTEREDGAIHFNVRNLQAAHVTVRLEMKFTNLEASVPFPFTASFAGETTTRAFTLTPTEPGGGWDWEYKYYSTWGCKNAEHDDDFIYWLPYAPGERFRVSQGFHGRHSHVGAGAYAIDWSMPLGSPIHAARGGTIVSAKDDSDRGGPDRKYEWDANYILIKHDDGTYGYYVHLLKGGNRVQIGQEVQAGDWIGRSGNTGFSTGPHLHFSVFKGGNGRQRQTVPIEFRTSRSQAVTLREGRSYQSPLNQLVQSTAN